MVLADAVEVALRVAGALEQVGAGYSLRSCCCRTCSGFVSSYRRPAQVRDVDVAPDRGA